MWGRWIADEVSETEGVAKTGGGDGWADVWKRGCFAWEYKGRHKDLDAAAYGWKDWGRAGLPDEESSSACLR